MKSTITLQEANQRVGDYIQQVRTIFPSDTEIKLSSQFDKSDCSDPSDNGPAGRYFASRSYQVLGTPKETFSSHFESLREWGQRHNFRVLDNADQPDFLALESDVDGFRVSLKYNDLGEMYLGGSSPCVWPSGTPEPRN